MVGAVTTTVAGIGALTAIVPAVYLAVAVVIAWARRDRTAQFAAQLTRRGR